MNDHRHGRTVGEGAEEEGLRFRTVHNVSVLVRHQTDYGVRPGFGRRFGQPRSRLDAFFGDIRNHGTGVPIFQSRDVWNRQFPQLHSFFGVK